jgi:hypothetical protein
VYGRWLLLCKGEASSTKVLPTATDVLNDNSW